MIKTGFILAITMFLWGGPASVEPVSAAPKGVKGLPFDSSANFLGTDVARYIGQDLYLVEKPAVDRDFGYSGFYSKPDSIDQNVYRPNEKDYTTYSAIAGKHFKVLDVIILPDASPDIFANGKCLLQLQERDSSGIIYYEYNSMNSISFPFIVTGFYEKQKKLYKGSYFVYADTVLRTFANKTDTTTGKPITFRTGETWKCVDVTIPLNSNNIALVIQNNLGEKTTVPFGTRAYSLIESLTYRKKYGIAVFNRLLRGDLYPGMTKEMVKLSVGEPYQVNSSLSHMTNVKSDEWMYYSGKSLIFRDDKLVELKDTQTN